MTRMSCDGILAKGEMVCYSCGEPVPRRSKSKGPGLSAFVPLALIISFGLAVYSFFSAH